MKLKPLERPIPPAPVSFEVPGKLKEALDDYARYFEAEHGQQIDLNVLLVQIISAFVASDHGFTRWRRARSGKNARRMPKSARVPSNGTAVPQ